ncbi:hypothetical protein HDV03_001156 [Kappamyces sp. JEL0829]|nr:hypothetical protein HDV03_001156 [Kappamyces sp. JEL0829]
MLAESDLTPLVKYIFSHDIAIHHDPQGILKAGTGATIWDSSLVLGKYLEKVLETEQDIRFKKLQEKPDLTILELGSGTGLLGLMLHSLFPQARICLTDQESVLPLLATNVNNRDRIQVKELQWGTKEHIDDIAKDFPTGFDLVVHSDLITWPNLYSDLIETLDAFTRPQETLIVFSHESREFEKEAKFYAKLSKKGFVFRNVESHDQDEHAKELGNAVPTKPMLFLKPPSSIIGESESIELPKGVVLHHELELGVVIGKEGRDIASRNAYDYVQGYTLALDMTARNIQDEAKAKGHPWSVAKGYDTFTPVGTFIPKSEIADPHNLRLTLKVDNKTAQDGSTSDMLFDIPTLIEHVSKIMKLEKGDLILTGTPSGVGPVVAGQTLYGKLTDGDKPIAAIAFPVIDRKES